MYLTHNERKSVVAEIFIKTLKSKIYKTMTANDSKSYLGYLNRRQIKSYLSLLYWEKPIDVDC